MRAPLPMKLNSTIWRRKKMERKAISHSENSIGKQTASDLSMHYYILLDQITRPSKHVFYLATCWYEPVWTVNTTERQMERKCFSVLLKMSIGNHVNESCVFVLCERQRDKRGQINIDTSVSFFHLLSFRFIYFYSYIFRKCVVCAIFISRLFSMLSAMCNTLL